MARSAFTMSPTEASESIYHTSLFSETRKLGDSLRTTIDKNSRIAVLGSEPEIYFIARHRSATGLHLYVPAYGDTSLRRADAARNESLKSKMIRNRNTWFMLMNRDFLVAAACISASAR